MPQSNCEENLNELQIARRPEQERDHRTPSTNVLKPFALHQHALESCRTRLLLRESPGNSERFILGVRQLFCTSRKSKIKSSRIRVTAFDADSGPARAGASAHISNAETPI